MSSQFDFQNADLQGMQNADRRYSGGAMFPAQIEQQYREIQVRKPSQVVSYVEEEKPDTGELSPEEKRMWKRIQLALPTGAATLGIGYVVMSGALNSMIGVLIGCVAGGFLLSGFGSAMSGSSTSVNERTNAGQVININISNSGGANQNNK